MLWCVRNTNFLCSVCSLTQPVVVKQRVGETAEDLDARTPTVYIIGSKMNVAMYANTLTPTTKVKDSDGQFVVVGKQYACMFNAQWVQLLRYCLAAAVATTFSEPCIACPPNFLGLSKISLDIFPQRAGLSPLLSIHSACREGVCALHQLAKYIQEKRFTCVMHRV